MTIRQLQELYFIGQEGINQTDADTFDKSIRMVGVMSGKTPEKVEKMGMARFNKYCQLINEQFDIIAKNLYTGKPRKIVYCKGRIYRMNYEITKDNNAAIYVDNLHYGKDVVQNLHKIMASIATPIRFSLRKFKFIKYERDRKDIAQDFERLNFEAAYHAAVFFYTLFSVSMQVSRPYLVKQMISKGIPRKEAEETLTNSSNILDGFIMPRWSQTLKEYLLNRFGASA